jgi:hypothetical protein
MIARIHSAKQFVAFSDNSDKIFLCTKLFFIMILQHTIPFNNVMYCTIIITVTDNLNSSYYNHIVLYYYRQCQGCNTSSNHEIV